jgi:hypothetical protein
MNLPIVHDALVGAWPAALAWAAGLAVAAALLIVGARRMRWGLVFAALVLLVAATGAAVNHAFAPRLARDRTYKPFVAAALRDAGSSDRLFFYATFDYGAVFYARRHIPVLAALPPDSAAWLLVTEPAYATLPDEERTRMSVVERSEGTGPEGRERYLLVRVGERSSAMSDQRPATTAR